jgi:hypothetical protein
MSVVAGRPPRFAADEAVTEPASGRAKERQARLTAGIAGVRLRGSLSLERVLLIAGSVLIPLGVLLILLGWWGVSHSTLQVEQNSYLISGGLLGLALVVTGGFFYFGYWLTRQVQEARRHNERLVTALSAIEARLADRPTGPVPIITPPAAHPARAEDPPETGSESNGTPRARSRPLRARPLHSAEAAIEPSEEAAWTVAVPSLVATPNGSLLHRADCAVVAKRDDLRRLPADAAGFTPCQICQPLSD